MAYDGMFLPPDQDPRDGTAPPRGERANLVDYLERYRTTLELKCDGLDPEQMARRSVPPSSMSLLGLVRHMARVEHRWFRLVIERRDLPRLYDDGDAGFAAITADDAAVADAWDSWHREVAYAREVLAGTDLDDLVEAHGEQYEVRDIVVHMIEEYARHVGHADLLRECIDGRTGQ